MAKKPLPTPDELRQLLRYEPDTGKLFWRHRGPEWYADKMDPKRCTNSFNGQFAGKEAFTSRNNYLGHKRGTILNSDFYAHRVAWAIHYGNWPEGEIDHIDGDPANNSIDNLRSVSRLENTRNKAISRNNTSGFSGVHFDTRDRKWIARISVRDFRFVVGRFDTYECAKAARQQALDAAGFHRNHGRSRIRS